jgi:hypothetical protein
MSGGVIGIAYVAVICRAGYPKFGLSQYVAAAANWKTFAHEVGHNFGASHDAGSNQLMNPAPLNAAPEFSQQSLDEINAHLGQYNACLGQFYDGGSLPSLFLQTSLTSAGVYRAKLTVSEPRYADCFSRLVFSDSADFTYALRYRVASGSVGSTRVGTTMLRKAKRRWGSSTVFIKAEYVCPGAPAAAGSALKSINAGTVLSGQPSLGLRQWIDRLRRKLATL